MDGKQITGPGAHRSLQFPKTLDVAGACKSALKPSPVLLKCPEWSWFPPGPQVDMSVPCSLLNPVYKHCWSVFQSPKPNLKQSQTELNLSLISQSDPEAWTAG